MKTSEVMKTVHYVSWHNILDQKCIVCQSFNLFYSSNKGGSEVRNNNGVILCVSIEYNQYINK